MRRATATVAILCLAMAGCSGGVIDLPIEDTSWSLTADVDDALVDLQHPEFGTYPNPRGLKQMQVLLENDGRLCANDGNKEWCGGPVQGIPYLTILNVRPDSYCVRVVDLFGNYVRTGCQEGPPPETYSSVLPNVVAPAPDDVSAPGDTQSDVLAGAKAVTDAINAGLAKIGLKVRVPLPLENQLADFEKGDILVGKGTCEDVNEYLDDEFSDDHPGTDDYVFGPEAIKECLDEGSCRVGQLVTRAMAEACDSIPAGAQTYQYETGIVGGGGNGVGVLCDDGATGEIEKCVGSPLVLDLAGDGLQLKGPGAGVTFPLFGTRSAIGWLSGSDDALLALDLNGNGNIDSGRELFGEAMGTQGFAALARHDANHDGVISPDDPVFDRLLAWQDDGDGRSDPSELHTLRSLGIRAIPLRHERSGAVDAFGNELRLLGAAQGAEGRAVPLVDVFFRIGR